MIFRRSAGWSAGFLQPIMCREADMKNVGGIDRALRIVGGLIVLSLVFVGPQTPWGWIGVVPLLTGLLGWCPAYHLLGIRTCPAAAAPGKKT